MRTLNSKPPSLSLAWRLRRVLTWTRMRKIVLQRSAYARHILGVGSAPACMQRHQ